MILPFWEMGFHFVSGLSGCQNDSSVLLRSFELFPPWKVELAAPALWGLYRSVGRFDLLIGLEACGGVSVTAISGFEAFGAIVGNLCGAGNLERAFRCMVCGVSELE